MMNEQLYFLLGFVVGMLFALGVWLRAYATRLSLIKEQALATTKAQVEIAELRQGLLANDDKSRRLDEALRENNAFSVEVSRLKAENEKSREYLEARITDLSALQNNMKEVFANLSKEAMLSNASLMNDSFKKNLEHFFKLSEAERVQHQNDLGNLVSPLKESIAKVTDKVIELEKVREGAYSGLTEQVGNLLNSQNELQKQTYNLVRALSAPAIRGRWGEMQLRRVVELSGMSAHCDFLEQSSIRSENEIYRPDMIVTLPQNRKVIVDAKAPMEAILGQVGDASQDSKHEDKELAQALRRHLMVLKKKSYFRFLGQSPEFVVMFVPGEVFLHRALLADPDLIDFAAQNEVVIATPATLIALLKAVAFSFRQEAMAQNVEEARALSEQLIDRVNKVAEHFEKLGKHLRQATESYNQTLVSLDSRVLVTARKLAGLRSIGPKMEQEVSDDAVPSELLIPSSVVGDSDAQDHQEKP